MTDEKTESLKEVLENNEREYELGELGIEVNENNIFLAKFLSNEHIKISKKNIDICYKLKDIDIEITQETIKSYSKLEKLGAELNENNIEICSSLLKDGIEITQENMYRYAVIRNLIQGKLKIKSPFKIQTKNLRDLENKVEKMTEMILENDTIVEKFQRLFNVGYTIKDSESSIKSTSDIIFE